MPTYNRLKRFIEEEAKLPITVQQLTVKAIIQEMTGYIGNACWDILKEHSHGGRSTTTVPESQLDQAMFTSGALQQVFAYCAEPVKKKLDELGDFPPRSLSSWLESAVGKANFAVCLAALTALGVNDLVLLKNAARSGVLTVADLIEDEKIPFITASTIISMAKELP